MNTTTSFERIQRTKKQPKSSDHPTHSKRSDSRKQARAHKLNQRYHHSDLD